MKLVSLRRTVRVLALSANGVLLALVVTGAAAAYLDPGRYWLGAMVAIILPLLSGLLLPFSVFLWADRKRVLALVQLGLVLALGSRHVSLDRLSQQPATAHDLVLMTFNAPRAPDLEELGEEIAGLVGALGPDVIALQESTIYAYEREPDQLRSFAKFSPLIDSLDYSMHLPPAASPGGKGWNAWYQPVLARFEIDRQDQLSFRKDDRDGPELLVLRSEFSWQGRKVAHYNVHLASHRPTERRSGRGRLQIETWKRSLQRVRESYRVRAWEVEQIRELIESESHPVILSGDFNSTPDSWVYRRLSEGLQDAYRIAGRGWGATYHTKLPILRIDFVLLGPEFEAVHAEVPQLSELVSDHRPLIARFRWRP